MSDSSELYKIGTVAKLTGIAVERLRAWERRYGLTPASREGKTRFFSGIQVERLTRIKRLIDQGHPVSTLINLDDEALNERLQQVIDESSASAMREQGIEGQPLKSRTRVGLIGTQLLMLEQMLAKPSEIDTVSRWVNLSVALPELTTAEQPPEVAVVLLGSVTPDSLDQLSDLPAKTKPLVVYHYATEEGLDSANDREWELLRWPVAWHDIEAAVDRQAKSPLRASKQAPRRFSDEQLLSIASAGPGLGCACPADLVNLISALNAFSDHTAACSSQPFSPDDESAPTARARPGRAGQHSAFAHHSQIATRTSQARLELELVLEDWVMAEGLLPTPN